MACSHEIVVAKQAWSESETEMSETERTSSTSLVIFRVSVARVVHVGGDGIVKQHEVHVSVCHYTRIAVC
jgi:hypothetical protein